MVTAGDYYNRGGKHYILYDEVTEGMENQGHNKTDENPYEFFVSDEAERFRAFADSILPVDITTARQIQIEEY